MKKFLFSIYIAIGSFLPLHAAEPAVDYSRIDVNLSPFYNANGPSVKVGRFSSGLASTNEEQVLATVAEMKKDWERLAFPELYVGAVRLYDFGYRKESVYWFYSAQYRGRQFGMLLDQKQMGGMGARGFELFHAQKAFYELIGPYINAYGFGDMDGLVKILEQVRKEGRKLPDLEAVYRDIAFHKKNKWKSTNTELADGMKELIAALKAKKDDIRRQRMESGVDKIFSELTSKELPRH